jgi:hypothetical protein
MKNLIRTLLKEHYDDDIQLEILKKELIEVEEDYEDIIKKYKFLKRRIEILEYRKNIPYNIGYVKDKYGNEYINVRIEYPFVKTEKKYPYYRLYVGRRDDLESLGKDEMDKRIRQVIQQYLSKNFPL